MHIAYSKDSDTLYVEFNTRRIVETAGLDENTRLDMDAAGSASTTSFEHASKRTELHRVSVSGLSASWISP